MFTTEDVAEVRHVVQRILVPCVFVVGLLGNSVSIYVLTRKRMRCTTNIYLTALAITDIIYLTMALLLSLKHYEYVQRNCEIYFEYYGTVVWLCDACAYISIYIAVCFTIERFIAIRYPLKRQTFCTESLAKKVIAGVALFCLLSTISTAFEHEYTINSKFIDSQGTPCNLSSKTTPHNLNGIMWQGSGGGSIEDDLSSAVNGATTLWDEQNVDGNLLLAKHQNATIDVSKPALKASTAANNIPNRALESYSLESHPDYILAKEFLASSETTTIPTPLQRRQMNIERNLSNDKKLQQTHDNVTFNITEHCHNVTFYRQSNTNLANNALYRRVWYYFTLFVFALVPLCVLGTFNCFLIMLVRRSKNLRGEMTNATSIRRPNKRKSNSSSVSQENRVTVTLIAVVLLFICCQLPWAIYLIVSDHMEINQNLEAIIGNVFNLLAAINAAANFFLYCVLSDKYRKTVRELITNYKYRGMHRNTHTSTSLYATTHTTVNGSRRFRTPATSVVIK